MLELVQLTFVFGPYNRKDPEALSNYDLFHEYLTCTMISLLYPPQNVIEKNCT